ncbi:MAG: hypothetical protein ACC618_01530 [Patescibacteria group bacterium]
MSKKFIMFIVIPGLLLIAIMIFIINSELIIIRQGVLTRVTNCWIPEGCGTEYKVDSVDVVGNLREKDVGKIVEVIGIETSLPSFVYGETYKGIRVIYYRPILRGAK